MDNLTKGLQERSFDGRRIPWNKLFAKQDFNNVYIY